MSYVLLHAKTNGHFSRSEYKTKSQYKD